MIRAKNETLGGSGSDPPEMRKMNLKEIRKERGLTQSELAKTIGAKQSRIARYEAGNREPDLKTLNKLANALGCSLDELIGESKTEE